MANMIALFDFDGVLMDTETQYSRFWDETGRKYLNIEGFGSVIKGQTLKQIFGKHFAAFSERELRTIEDSLNEYESQMSYEFIPGAREFLLELKKAGVPTAIVTSSGLSSSSSATYNGRRHPYKRTFLKVKTRSGVLRERH